jgi:hypothetical protein
MVLWGLLLALLLAWACLRGFEVALGAAAPCGDRRGRGTGEGCVMMARHAPRQWLMPRQHLWCKEQGPGGVARGQGTQAEAAEAATASPWLGSDLLCAAAERCAVDPGMLTGRCHHRHARRCPRRPGLTLRAALPVSSSDLGWWPDPRARARWQQASSIRAAAAYAAAQAA